MPDTEYAILIDGICGLAGVIVILPLLLYLYRPWTTRRDKLLSNLDSSSLILYYRQFYPDKDPCLKTVQSEFRAYFNRHYGRRNYLVPIIALIIVTVLAGTSIALSLQVWQKVSSAKYALSPIVVSALAGGFSWVVNDLINRFRRRDFTVNDVYNAIFRILIAVPFGWSFSQIVKADVGIPLAFLLGAFPTRTLFKFARRIASTKLGVSEDSDAGKLELEGLQSITKTNAELFYEENISTIVQLAYADPIDLTIRTNFDFNYVLDCVSQALLWIYLEKRMRDLTIYSLRGAQEAASLIRNLRLTGSPSQAQAQLTINAIAAELKISPASVKSTLEEVEGDPYTQFICSIWH